MLAWLAMWMAFPIQQQIHKDACIAASTSSLLAWLQKPALTQQALDPLIRQGMKEGNNGFDSLRAALLALGSPAVAQRFTPTDPAAWANATPGAASGFLISHGVNLPNGLRAAHITVVFRDGETWYQADPGTASIHAIKLAQLQPDYAGDLATIS
jgi:hypothetical protein